MGQKGLSSGFKALLVSQFGGAFNDNVLKLIVAFVAIDRFSQMPNGALFLSLSTIIFILPFLLFSTYAGFLADRISKQKIIIGVKVVEFLILFLGWMAFVQRDIWFLLFILFLMGVHSTFFSPAKYGILPEILPKENLSLANGHLEMWTYLAIILGQASAGYLIQVSKGNLPQAMFFLLGVCVVSIVASLYIPPVEAAKTERHFEWNVFREVFRNVKQFRKDPVIYWSLGGLAYFGFLAGLFHLNILLFARLMMGLDHLHSSLLLVVLALGICAGSVLCGKLSDHKVELGLVPLGAFGLGISVLVLGGSYHSFIQAAVVLFLLGVSAGFFMVPLNTFLQQRPQTQSRGQLLATNNFLSFTAILLGAAFLYLLRDFFHLNPAQIFVVMGLMTLTAAVYVCRLLPYPLVRLLVWILVHTVYRIRVIDRENIPREGGALLVSNHVSFIDALTIVVSTERPIRFMVHRGVYHLKHLNPILRLSRAIPIAQTDKPKELALALKEARQALLNNELVCIFAEGQLTRTGNLLKFNKGFEHIMKDAHCPIVPVNLDRIWGSIFSFEGGKYYYKTPKIIPYPITVSFGQPMPATSTAFEVRRQVMELGAAAFKYRLENRLTLSEAFWKEARRHPAKFCVADSGGRKLNYANTLISAVTVADQLKKQINQEQNVGILLPPSVAGVLANLAVGILNKVSVNLNYTAAKESLESVFQQTKMPCVLTSKQFLDKLQISIPCETIFIEELVRSLSTLDKLKAAFKAAIYPTFISHRLVFGKRRERNIENLATIMFTSGSTGEPKGVMLTHANITSNLEGLYQVFHTRDNDVVMGVLPFFHSFGFTATLWFPLIGGIGAVYHFNPLDAKTVGQLTEKHKATILMATPTFLNTYIHRCEPEQFKSLRIVIVGAEKLKDTVREAFKEKFGLEAMEGYGCTELSPIAAINIPDYEEGKILQKAHKPGTIGLPLPGVAVRIVEQDSLKILGPEENGLLLVKGPNVMKGYLNRDEATRQAIVEGWYRTGDIALIDEDGFIKITDRLSRFSKIAGEMVPHIKIEETIHSVLNATEQICAVTSLPDEKKGEKLAVLYVGEIDIKNLIEQLKANGLPNLWIPDAELFFKIDKIPILGSGKMDLGGIKRKALDLVGSRA